MMVNRFFNPGIKSKENQPVLALTSDFKKVPAIG
jgi:hypothetical protein